MKRNKKEMKKISFILINFRSFVYGNFILWLRFLSLSFCIWILKDFLQNLFWLDNRGSHNQIILLTLLPMCERECVCFSQSGKVCKKNTNVFVFGYCWESVISLCSTFGVLRYNTIWLYHVKAHAIKLTDEKNNSLYGSKIIKVQSNGLRIHLCFWM